MHREHNLQFPIHFQQRVENESKSLFVIHIGRTMQGDEGVSVGQVVQVRFHRLGQKPYQRVDHDIADAVYLAFGNTFMAEILVRFG